MPKPMHRQRRGKFGWALLLTAIVAASLGACARGQSQLPTGSFKDCADCPVMLRIPTGSFVMGVPAAEEQRESPMRFGGQSAPQHSVTVPAFALGAYDVMRGEFEAFVRDTGYQTEDRCNVYVEDAETGPVLPENVTKLIGEVFGKALGMDLKQVKIGPMPGGVWSGELRSGVAWRNPGFQQTDRDPVVCVSWDDAKAYVAWLSRKAGRSYRLPSEAEWEYAARAGSTSARFWGDDRAQTCRYANVRDLTYSRTLASKHPELGFDCSDGYAYTAPAGSFAPNPFGLYDMLGNVAQWVEDCWNDSYQGAPSDGSARVAEECLSNVQRGGSWVHFPRAVRAGYRERRDRWGRDTFTGFRVATAN